MNREDIQKLLGGYATGTLTPEEQQALFEAALDDQELFDALAREEPLRDLLRDPAAKAQLLAALDEKPARWYQRLGWRPAAAVLAIAGIGAIAVVAVRRERTPERVLVAEVDRALQSRADQTAAARIPEPMPAAPAVSAPADPTGTTVRAVKSKQLFQQAPESGTPRNAPVRLTAGQPAVSAGPESRSPEELKAGKPKAEEPVVAEAPRLEAAPPVAAADKEATKREGPAKEPLAKSAEATTGATPTTTAPAPVASAPAPTTTAPASAASAPAPVASAPAPATTTAAPPAAGARAPAATAPAPAPAPPAPNPAQVASGFRDSIGGFSGGVRGGGGGGRIAAPGSPRMLAALSAPNARTLFYSSSPAGPAFLGANTDAAQNSVEAAQSEQQPANQSNQQQSQQQGAQNRAMMSRVAAPAAKARQIAQLTVTYLGVRYRILRKSAGGEFTVADPQSLRAGDTVKVEFMPNDTGMLSVTSGGRMVVSRALQRFAAYTTEPLSPGNDELTVTFSRPAFMAAAGTLNAASGSKPASESQAAPDSKKDAVPANTTHQVTAEDGTYVVSPALTSQLQFTIHLNSKP